MPFDQSPVHVNVRERLFRNVDALSGVFSFLEVSTAARFACTDFFAAWYNITGTPRALRVWDRVETMFKAWYDRQILWYLNGGSRRDYLEGTSRQVFCRFLSSHALAVALNDVFHLCSLKRRDEVQSLESQRKAQYLPRKKQRDAQYLLLQSQRKAHYLFTENRLKKSIPLVLQDWTSGHAPLTEYASSPRALMLSYLVFAHAPVQALAWSKPYRPGKVRYDTLDDVAQFHFDENVCCNYIVNVIMSGLMTADLFMYICTDERFGRGGYEFFFHQKGNVNFLPAVDKMVQETQTQSVKYMLHVVNFYEYHFRHLVDFVCHDKTRSWSWAQTRSKVLPFLKKCFENPKLVDDAKKLMKKYTCTTWRGDGLDHLLAKKKIFY